MSKIVFFDCFSGVAGDMLLAALLDAEIDPQTIIAKLKTMTLVSDEWDLEFCSCTKSAGQIAAKYVEVKSVFGCKAVDVPKSTVPNIQDHKGDIFHDHNHSHSQQGGIKDHDHDEAVMADCKDDGHSHDHSHDSEHSHAKLTHESHAHDHTHVNSHDHSHGHDHDHEHSHGHSHGHDGAGNSRNLIDIANIVLTSDLSDYVKATSIASFYELAIAEAKVHGSTPENVHFHEVGAIDSIIDTVGVVTAVEMLGADEVHCSPLPMSSGTVWAAHGIMPVPAPATLNLMKGMVLCPGPKSAQGELVTPTGAALIRALCGASNIKEFPPFNGKIRVKTLDDIRTCSGLHGLGQGVIRQGTLPPSFRLTQIGTGAGKKDFEKHPNILRVLVGEKYSPQIQSESSATSLVSTSPSPVITRPTNAAVEKKLQVSLQGQDNSFAEFHGIPNKFMLVIEANIDDATPELLGYVSSLLLEAGANDVWQESIIMKKNRHATKLCILCNCEDKEKYLSVLFKEMSSIGARTYEVERTSLERQIVSIPTTYGPVSVKMSYLQEKLVNVKAEYEDCVRIARERQVPLKQMLNTINCEIHSQIK